MTASLFSEILKFNPYHDSMGRFATANGAAGGNTETREHLGFMSYDEAVANTMKECNVTDQEAKDMLKAVSGYAEGYAYSMRGWQATGSGDNEMTSAEAKEMSDNLEKFIQNSPKWGGGELYRGISVDENTAHKICDKALANSPIDMKGTSSWSNSRDIADEFADGPESDVAIIFRVAGTKKGTSIDHISEFSQSEVVISKDARWKCKRIDGSIEDQYLEILLEEIP